MNPPYSQYNVLKKTWAWYHSIIRFLELGVILSLLSPFVISSYGKIQAQKPELKFHQIQEGLNSRRISAIYQDHMGFMWIGTASGLHRFDGIEFHVYSSTPDSNSISDNYIGAIYEDYNNDLWIGDGGGVERYNRDTDDFTRFELKANSQIERGESVLVNTILEDKNGTLWVSSREKGLYYLNKEIQQFIQYEGLNVESISSIAVDSNNNLWVATYEEGLIRLNTSTGEMKSFMHNSSDPQSLTSNLLYRVITDSEGNLWIGTDGGGLDRLEIDDVKPIFHHYRHEPGNTNSLGNNDVFAFYIANDGNLWVGNENGGLHLYDKKTDSFFRYESDPTDPTSLNHNSIWSIYKDNQNRLWVGTAQSGLNIADRFYSKFTSYNKNSSTENGLTNDIIRDFWVEDNGDIWIATDGGGLNYLARNSKRFRAYMHNPDNPYSLGANAVIALNKDKAGNLWVGTWAGGLNIMLNKNKGVFTTFQDYINNHTYSVQSVFDVLFDDPYIWISSFGEGLIRYNKNNKKIDLFSTIQNDPSSLSSFFILKLFEDSKGNIWIGTLRGLNFIPADEKDKDQIKFREFLHSETDPTTIAGNTIHQIMEDSHQNIWIANVNGLSKYIEKENRFKNYNESDGLPANEVKSIIEDDKSYLWLGTINGISRFDPVNETFVNFNKSDGLQNREFSRYAVDKTPNGELLFGGLEGFELFNPDDIHNNPFPPPVYLTDLKIFNKSVNSKQPDSPLQKHISVADTLELSYKQNVITFNFVALNFTRPEQNQYAYMVEGFDDNWNYVGTQRNATYTNLDPGKYIFRVKASNNDGVWNEEGTSLTLIITPPFWQTIWFYLLASIFVIGVILGGYRIRVRSIRNHNRQLERQVADRTQQLEEKNEALEVALKELQETKDELVEKAHKAGMADIATGVIHNVGNILTSVNTSASLIEDTVRQSKLEGLQQANIILRENIDHIEEFIARNPKGKSLLEYYLKIEDPLKIERDHISKQTKRLIEKIELINEVIVAQQSYAGIGIHSEEIILADVIENALALQAGSIERHGLDVEKDLQATETIFAQRSKLIHVLVNVLKNAKDAMANNPPGDKKISIKTWQDENSIYLSITDNGEGIKREHMDKIFNHGFTTKRDGHGFGLHSSANYMREMNAKIKVSSNGSDKGATFLLSFRITDNQHDKSKEEIGQ